MKNKIILLILFLVFTGCSLKQQTIIDINHYSIDFKSNKKLDTPKLSSIFIEEPNVNRSFNLTSMFYSTKQYSFEEYTKNKWINFPSNMIHNQLIDSFITSNIFENIVLRDKKIDYEYLLKTEVIKLYQIFEDNKSYAILKFKFDLIKDNKVFKSFTFDKKIVCKSNNAYGFVKAVNNGFEDSINNLLNDLINTN